MPEYKHFILIGTAASKPFTPVGGGGGAYESPPRPERKSHGERLLKQLAGAERVANDRLKTTPAGQGLQFIPLDFEESSDFEMELDRIESESRRIRVLNVRTKGGRLHYLVAVPNDQVAHFATRFREYMTEDNRYGSPKNEPLASGISNIESGDFVDYWTDADEVLPEPGEQFWWEVWLYDDGSLNVAAWFRDAARTQGIRVSDESVKFPERVVVLAFASRAEWEQVPGLLQRLVEFRRANIVTSEFIGLSPSDQSQFITDLLGRLHFATPDAPAVCILDTGVNRGHPLLAPALDEGDTHTWNPDWTSADRKGHGTEVAGLALYGDLGELLLNTNEHELKHRLESVKILPDVGDNDPPDYGPITVGSMAVAEQQAPHRSQTYCMAVTAPSERDAWRPSLWSATIDRRETFETLSGRTTPMKIFSLASKTQHSHGML